MFSIKQDRKFQLLVVMTKEGKFCAKLSYEVAQMNHAQFQEFSTSVNTPDYFGRKINRQLVAGFSTFQNCNRIP